MCPAANPWLRMNSWLERSGAFDSRADAIPPLPSLFLARMAALLGEQYAPFAASYQQTAQVGLRVNTLKISPAAFADLSPFPLRHRYKGYAPSIQAAGQA